LTAAPPTAFISYCRDDSEFASRLAEDLKAAGAPVWLDQVDIVPGELWDVAVERALNQCPRMLVILSPASVSSPNVLDEVSFALKKGKTVIPVLHRDCEIPFRLDRLQHLDFRTNYDRGLKALLRVLAVQPLAEPAPPAPVENHPAPSTDVQRPAVEAAQAPGSMALEHPSGLRSGIPTWAKAATAVCAVLIVAAILYWAIAVARKPQIGSTDRSSATGTAPQSSNDAVWITQASGMEHDLLSIAFPTPQSGWAVGSHGTILHTEDGGITWKTQATGTQEDLRSVAFPAALSGWAVGSFGAILHTEDGGITWKTQINGTQEDLRSVTFPTPLSGWTVGLHGTILHTEDGGNSWKPQTSGSESWLNSVAFLTPQSGWVVGTNGTILYTRNAGHTWTKQPTGTMEKLLSAAFPTPHSGWVVGTGGIILHTDDGGATWNPQPSHSNSLLEDIAFPAPRSGWTVGNGGLILHTSDGGKTWNRQTTNTKENLVSVAFPTPHSGWAVGNKGTILHLSQ